MARINSTWLLVACNTMSGIAIILQFIASFPSINTYVFIGAGLALISVVVAIWQGFKSSSEQKQETTRQITYKAEQDSALQWERQKQTIYISLIAIGIVMVLSRTRSSN